MELTTFGNYSDKKTCLHFSPLDFIHLQEIVESQGKIEKTKASWLIEFGAVYVNKVRVTDRDFIVGPKDVVRIHLEPKRYSLNKEKIQANVVCETENYIVVNKPSGLPMHPTLDNLYENLLEAFEKKVYVTHRLDVPTSGLVLVAKTKEYQSKFNSLVAARQLKKLYLVLSHKLIVPGLYRHFMKVSVKAPKEVFLTPPEQNLSDECLLEVVTSQKVPGYFKHWVLLHTGRTHQIRAQFSALGAPIIGDEMYGGTPSEFFGLHSYELQFNCPIENRIVKFQTQSRFPD